MEKYWVQRYRFFTKFDEGIQMDEGMNDLQFLLFVFY